MTSTMSIEWYFEQGCAYYLLWECQEEWRAELFTMIYISVSFAFTLSGTNRFTPRLITEIVQATLLVWDWPSRLGECNICTSLSLLYQRYKDQSSKIIFSHSNPALYIIFDEELESFWVKTGTDLSKRINTTFLCRNIIDKFLSGSTWL